MAKHSTWNSGKVKALARKVGMQALHEGAWEILKESRKEVPHDTGMLQDSSIVDPKPSEDAVYISYSTPYALRQHEDLTLRHPDPTNPRSTPGRKAKYLEDPFHRLKDKVMQMVRLRILKALKDAKE